MHGLWRRLSDVPFWRAPAVHGCACASNLLFAFSVKSGLIAIACRHTELPLIRLLPVCKPNFLDTSGLGGAHCKEKPLFKKHAFLISQSRSRTLLERQCL